MFERFNDSARQVVRRADGAAKSLGHNYIGTEHLLLGLVCCEGAMVGVLNRFELFHDQVREQVLATIGSGQATPNGHIPLTPRAKQVLELALRESLQLGHSFIGPEHILLALVREDENAGTQILCKLGVDLDELRQAVLAAASG